LSGAVVLLLAALIVLLQGAVAWLVIAGLEPHWAAFLVGLAASLGAGISMGFSRALSDDGSLTGRGHPWIRGGVCGAMTTLGGVGHTLPFLIASFQEAFTLAFAVVFVELAAITWIRHRQHGDAGGPGACSSAAHSSSRQAR
jgi:hypothetical protein